ncbi:MAG: hypothetical protein ACT4N2_16525 [Hyphomicrobium sp.]
MTAGPRSSIPNLYLKWRVLREIIGQYQPDHQIARGILGGENAGVLFSRLLSGDKGCAPEEADGLIQHINRRIETHRKARSLPAVGRLVLGPRDLSLDLYAFTRRVLESAEAVDAEALDRAHDCIIAGLSPKCSDEVLAPRLKIERLSRERAFTAARPSGEEGPVRFVPGRHDGDFLIEDLPVDPVAAYMLLARDTKDLKRRAWEHTWRDNVWWLPSPFRPIRRKDGLALIPEPQPILPLPGRWLATVVLVLEPKALLSLDPRLDPRKPDAAATLAALALDEPQTARFLTNLRHVASSHPTWIAVARNEYHVLDPE